MSVVFIGHLGHVWRDSAAFSHHLGYWLGKCGFAVECLTIPLKRCEATICHVVDSGSGLGLSPRNRRSTLVFGLGRIGDGKREKGWSGIFFLCNPALPTNRSFLIHNFPTSDTLLFYSATDDGLHLLLERVTATSKYSTRFVVRLQSRRSG